jgi:hypothetical protein
VDHIVDACMTVLPQLGEARRSRARAVMQTVVSAVCVASPTRLSLAVHRTPPDGRTLGHTAHPIHRDAEPHDLVETQMAGRRELRRLTETEGFNFDTSCGGAG